MESRKKERVLRTEIYTDGSLKKIGDASFGGWAFIITRDNEQMYATSGCEDSTTNQRMELTAILEALKYIQDKRRKNEKIVIISDSAYAINCYLQEWYISWQNNGWINSKGAEVANRDLWLQIIPFFDNYWYEFKHIKGHENNYWNDKCDEMAQAESQYLKDNWRGQNG